MSRVKKAEPELCLPRPLINQLLHSAQTGTSGRQWGIIGARDGIPQRCYPLSRLTVEQLAGMRDKLRQHGETLFGMYCSDASQAQAPDISELSRLGLSVSLLFSISLATKGVLQLRGWRVEGQRFSALEVGISET